MSVTSAPTETELARLWAEGLTKVYRKRAVVNGVDIEVRQGEIVGLLGPNGAGKTTTFYMVVGLIAPDRGTVHLDEENLTRTPMYKRARKGVGYLAQEPSIFRKLTVEENVLAILEAMDVPKAERTRRLETLLKELGLTGLRNSKAYSLSGGERRRLEITRALVQQPKFILLDEPFAGIDPIAVHDIQEIVADLKTRGIGVIISDHNVEQTLEIVDRAYIMYDGRIRVAGSVSELVWNDEVAEIYLGPILTARMRQRFPHPAEAEAEPLGPSPVELAAPTAVLEPELPAGPGPMAALEAPAPALELPRVEPAPVPMVEPEPAPLDSPEELDPVISISELAPAADAERGPLDPPEALGPVKPISELAPAAGPERGPLDPPEELDPVVSISELAPATPAPPAPGPMPTAPAADADIPVVRPKPATEDIPSVRPRRTTSRPPGPQRPASPSPPAPETGDE